MDGKTMNSRFVRAEERRATVEQTHVKEHPTLIGQTLFPSRRSSDHGADKPQTFITLAPPGTLATLRPPSPHPLACASLLEAAAIARTAGQVSRAPQPNYRDRSPRSPSASPPAVSSTRARSIRHERSPPPHRGDWRLVGAKFASRSQEAVLSKVFRSAGGVAEAVRHPRRGERGSGRKGGVKCS